VSHGAQTGIGTLPIAYFGTEEQKQKYLPKLASGEVITCYCLSEAEAGSDALAAKARADLSEDGKSWVLNGQKMWVTNGGFADVFIVFAKVDGDKFSCFIVEKNMPGVSTGAEEKKMGIKGSSTRALYLDSVRVPRENLLHEIGRGHIVAFNILNVGRFKLSAYSIGGCKYTLAEAVRYAKQRRAFGKAIAEFGLIQHKLAEMATRTYAGESMVYRTAGLIDAALAGVDLTAPDAAKHVLKALEEYAIECSINKVYDSEIVDYVVDEAVQIFGGYGYHQDYAVERAYRDARINRIFEGTNEINRLLITGMLFKRAMKGELALIPAAQKLQDEVLAGPQLGGEEEEEFLGAERRALRNAKKVFLLSAATSVQRYMDKLADQQEVVGGLSNIAMEVFAMESALLRTLKMVETRGEGNCAVPVAMTQVFIADAMGRVESEARTLLAAVSEGDMLRTQMTVLKRFAKRDAINTIALRQQIAQAVIGAEKYPV
jgi:alkylation response protein AidB-like acyl-CoA dehydrogenase